MRSIIMHSLRRGMILSVSVPLLISIGVSLLLALTNFESYRQATRLEASVEMLRALGGLMHEQQKERGATSIFINSSGQKFARELSTQRQRTDTAAATFLEQLEIVPLDAGSRLAEDMASIQGYLSKRQAIRASVDTLTIPASEALGHYTSHNAEILVAISHIGTAATDRHIAEEVASLEALLAAKEYAGIERAVGSGGFAMGEFNLGRIRTMERLISRQNLSLEHYDSLAQGVLRQAGAEIEALDATRTVYEMRDIAFASFNTGDFQGTTAEAFFAATTDRINAFKALENRIVDTVEQEAIYGARVAKTQLFTIGSASILALLCAVLMTRYVAGNMLTEVRRISDAGDRLAEGDDDVELPTDSPKELGRIVYSVNFFRESVLKAKEREAEVVRAREATERAARQEEEARQQAERDRVQKDAEAVRSEQERVRGYISDMSAMVNACARGDFTQTLHLDAEDGAWTEVADGLNRICRGVETSLNEIRQALGCMARGDMTYDLQGEFEGIFADIVEAVQDASGNISSTLSRVADNTSNVSSSSQRIAGTTDELSRSSEENATLLKQTAASIDEMSTLVRSAADSSQNVRANAAEISDQAAAEADSTKQTIDAMQEIQSSSEGIVKILSVMDDIAFQTNLLALNAGVEAARAGEAGRGFAVVATEVRALAQRSSAAAQEVAGLVETSAESIRRGVSMVDQTALSLTTVAAGIQELSDQVADITESFENTKSNIDRVSQTTASLDRSTHENAGKIEAARQSVERLKADATSLMSEVDNFVIRTGDGFSDGLRKSA